MATNDIGNITASLKLESAAFIRDLRRAADETARSTSAMRGSMASLQRNFAAVAAQAKGLVAAFIGVQGVRALVNLAAQAVRTADAIGEAADKIGVSGEELQRFRFAAAQAGVDTQALDASLRLFAQNLAEGRIAAQGRSITEAFTDYIARIEAAPTQLEKVRIAHEAFGKSWQEAMLLAARGSEQFREDAESASVISERSLAIASDLDNQFRAIGNAVEAGFDTGVLEGFAGALALSRDELSALAEVARDVGAVVGTVFRTIADAVEQTVDDYRALKGLISGTPQTNPLPPLPTFEELQAGKDLGIANASKAAAELGASFDKTSRHIGAWKTTVEAAKIPETVREWAQTFQDFGDVAANTFADAIVEARSWRDTLAELAKDIEKMFLSTAFRQLFGTLIGSPMTPGTPSTPATGLLAALGFHSGGVVGEDAPGFRRSMPALAYLNAPRFHAGLAPDEFPAILRRGEGVFTPKQMRALGEVAQSAGGGVTFNATINVSVESRNGSGSEETAQKTALAVRESVRTLVRQELARAAKLGGQLNPVL